MKNMYLSAGFLFLDLPFLEPSSSASISVFKGVVSTARVDVVDVGAVVVVVVVDADVDADVDVDVDVDSFCALTISECSSLTSSGFFAPLGISCPLLLISTLRVFAVIFCIS